MMKKFLFFLFSTLLLTTSIAQQLTQTVRGKVIDKDSNFPLAGVNVVLMDSEELVGTTTDSEGKFVLKNVPVGRQSLKISFVGYEDIVLSNLQILSAKEYQIMEIELKESVTSLNEVVVNANEDPSTLNNEMTLASARSFDLEETGRYAGTRNDPARMAANFAGVANNNDGRNDIIIRGNSPTGLLWRLEGLDIPNPNHYGSLGLTGGPVTILNNNQLAKSDFMTSAFPAEYGNALSGVFDLQLRNGNSYKRESLFQVAFNGLELGTEGPISKKSGSSYMINYRYSTLGFVNSIGLDIGTGSAAPQFQDLSFKVNVPTQNGAFEIFGLGGLSEIELLGSEEDLDSEDLFGDETQDVYNNNSIGITGMSYTHFLTEDTFLKIIGGASYTEQNSNVDSLVYEGSTTIVDKIRQQDISNASSKYTLHSYVNHKFNARNTLKAGLIFDMYDFDIDHTMYQPDEESYFPVRNYEGSSLLSRIYTSWKHRFSEKLTMTLGIHALRWELSETQTLEPRFAMQYSTDPKNTFSFGYGYHSQLQPLPIYFQTVTLDDDTELNTNEDLDFVRSHHWVAGYERSLTPNLRLKLESYYQSINNAGVESTPSSFSTLNVGTTFNIPDKNNLVNEGIGRNYGIEVTLEKFFSNNYYFLVTGSLFNSEYKGSDGIWRNTAFNGRYNANMLAGKEWNIDGNNTLAVDWKLTMGGGRYYTPVDKEASEMAGTEVLDEDKAFSEQLRDYFRMDFKLSYRRNGAKLTHEFSLDIQNITNRQNDFIQVYNRRTNEIKFAKQMGFFPIPQYKIYF